MCEGESRRLVAADVIPRPDDSVAWLLFLGLDQAVNRPHGQDRTQDI